MNENTEHKLRSDVVGYILDYSFTPDQRYTIPADRLNFWREYFLQLPDDQKKSVATELLAWAFKAHRVIKEQFGESAEKYVFLVEDAVRNTVEIVVILITKTAPSFLLQAIGNGVIESEGSLIAIKDGKLLPSALVAKQSRLPVLSTDQAYDRIHQTQKSIDQLRKHVSMLFRLTMFFASLGFVVIIAGVIAAIKGITPTNTITCISGLVTEGVAAIFFKKDRELRDRLAASELLMPLLNEVDSVNDPAIRDQARLAVINGLIHRLPNIASGHSQLGKLNNPQSQNS